MKRKNGLADKNMLEILDASGILWMMYNALAATQEAYHVFFVVHAYTTVTILGDKNSSQLYQSNGF